jgi:hypothetical protein
MSTTERVVAAVIVATFFAGAVAYLAYSLLHGDPLMM